MAAPAVDLTARSSVKRSIRPKTQAKFIMLLPMGQEGNWEEADSSTTRVCHRVETSDAIGAHAIRDASSRDSDDKS